jgi:hypothetical protein
VRNDRRSRDGPLLRGTPLILTSQPESIAIPAEGSSDTGTGTAVGYQCGCCSPQRGKHAARLELLVLFFLRTDVHSSTHTVGRLSLLRACMHAVCMVGTELHHVCLLMEHARPSHPKCDLLGRGLCLDTAAGVAATHHQQAVPRSLDGHLGLAGGGRRVRGAANGVLPCGEGPGLVPAVAATTSH